MQSKYQIIVIGSANAFASDILSSITYHITELGLDINETVDFIYANNFNSVYTGSSPAFGLYFGDVNGVFKDLSIAERLINDAILVIPIYNNEKTFKEQIPEVLSNNNGYELNSLLDIESIVNCLLEGLGLLRTTRRLFLSYRRSESTSTAIQLYEQLEKKGFDVFLDTHSIRPGEPFQEELWQRMADTDIIVILNTPKFLESEWCADELAEANTKSIGILQLVWPSHKLEDNAKLSVPLQLKADDFVNGKFSDPINSFLKQDTIDKISNLTESLRARSLASRQDNLITEFISAAKKLGLDVILQPERIIIQKMSNGADRIFIPTVGVPQSLNYNQSEELITRIRQDNVDSIFLLFDHRSIRDKWLSHLAWLDKYLKIKTVKIVDIQQWLQSN